MSLSERIKQAREALGLTQRQAAERSGLDDSAISRFEQEHQEPRLGQLEALAGVYHVPLGYFFEETAPAQQAVLWRNILE